MNKEVLEYFIKVYEKKSITAAAKDLFITPQGLSKTIKQLEMDLEAKLFIRGSHGMEATECGELLFARAKHICYLMDDLVKEISIMSGKDGILNVVVTFSTTIMVPADILFAFSNQYPDIQMKLRELPDEYPLGDLFQEEAEVGLIMGSEEIENCDCDLIGTGEVVILVSKRHPLAAKDVISITDLQNETLVIKSVEKGKEHSLIDKCLEHGFTPHIVHEFGNIKTAHSLCEANGYVAVSVDFVEEAHHDDRLKLVRLKEKIPQNIYLVSRKRDIESKSVSLFKNYIKDYCKDKVERF
ncbi:LysR family transcriptional regulator [Bacillus swezeyi]|uniref:LysR family transcriptional regulator n=1 Tax=Bacillus swezeyi TaxID=1925020 RepID=UPI0039C6E766